MKGLHNSEYSNVESKCIGQMSAEFVCVCVHVYVCVYTCTHLCFDKGSMWIIFITAKKNGNR